MTGIMLVFFPSFFSQPQLYDIDFRAVFKLPAGGTDSVVALGYTPKVKKQKNNTYIPHTGAPLLWARPEPVSAAKTYFTKASCLLAAA